MKYQLLASQGQSGIVIAEANSLSEIRKLAKPYYGHASLGVKELIDGEWKFLDPTAALPDNKGWK